ncbi:NifB/NifX family molybdenum-iron cluster-binding protein [Acetivibrio straminisolvens]|nr:NifB/NifX family molybdenum-iron cluster-binding protein [Acetivibrio straminisolvens]
MGYKVAVASSDGKVVNTHFGRALNFMIFEVDDSGWEFVESRENRPACLNGDHSEDGLLYTAQLLSDCKVVLVAMIGPGAAQVLEQKGIKAFSLAGYIDELLDRLTNQKIKI